MLIRILKLSENLYNLVSGYAQKCIWPGCIASHKYLHGLTTMLHSFSNTITVMDNNAVYLVQPDYLTSMFSSLLWWNRLWFCLLKVPTHLLPFTQDLQSKINRPLWHKRPYTLKFWVWHMGVTPAYCHVCKGSDTLLRVYVLHLHASLCAEKGKIFSLMYETWGSNPISLIMNMVWGVLSWLVASVFVSSKCTYCVRWGFSTAMWNYLPASRSLTFCLHIWEHHKGLSCLKTG